MVYCGKPSKGCAQCRVKRTKCDTKRPSCSQCIRAGRVCEGYRDPVDLSFRDQTAELTGKHQRKETTSSEPRAPAFSSMPSVSIANSNPSLEMDRLDDAWGTDVIVPSLLPSVESQALCYFFRNYVLEDYSWSKGYFDYLAQMYNNEPVGDALSDVVISLGLLGLGTSRNNSQAVANANARYSSALRATNVSLRNEKEAMADQTLITVMLLGLYETNACLTPRSMRTWTKHIIGASTMLQLRGKEQLRSRIGYQLFVQLRTQIIVNCLNRAAPIPDYLLEWTKYAFQFESNEESVGSALAQIVMKYCNLRSTLDSYSDFRNAEATAAAVLEIDSELNTWVNTCPAYVSFETVMMKERSNSVFSDYYHIYPNIWIASMWNHYRSIRILLNDLLIWQITYLKDRDFNYTDPSDDTSTQMAYDRQILISKSLLLQLAQDICASVPFFLDYHKLQDDPSLTFLPPRAAGGNLLLWPLFTAAVSGVVSDLMRSWIIGKLENITEVMGIRQARALAYVLSIRKDIVIWETPDGIELPAKAVDW